MTRGATSTAGSGAGASRANERDEWGSSLMARAGSAGQDGQHEFDLDDSSQRDRQEADGSCGGVARHWNVDPVLVRVGGVLLAFSGGIGIVLYLAGWLLIPADGATTSTLDDLTGGSSNPGLAAGGVGRRRRPSPA